ncbi:MAG: hypothetical protein Q4B35_03690 [Slackia sp.]|nr:hypothetical protein [Slackia sp.]
MAKSNVSRETRIAAGVIAICTVVCILYARAATRVGVAGLATYAAGAFAMVLAAVLLGGIVASLARSVLRDDRASESAGGSHETLSCRRALAAERPMLLCAAAEVAGVAGIWALGIFLSDFLPYGAVCIVLVAGVVAASIGWVVAVWRIFRARCGNRCSVAVLRGRVVGDAILVTIALAACGALALGVMQFARVAVDVATGPQHAIATIDDMHRVRHGDVRKGGFSDETMQVDFTVLQSSGCGVGQDAMDASVASEGGSSAYRIELSSVDHREVEFFEECVAGDRVDIAFYPRTETLVAARGA